MHVAIVRLTAMGDIIHTLAALQFVKDIKPDTTITWFVEAKFAPILAHNPHVDQIVPLDLHTLKNGFSLAKIEKIVSTIKKTGPFDLVVDVQGLIKSAIVAKIAHWEVAGLDFSSAKEPLAALLYTHRYHVDCQGVAPMRFASVIAQALDISITDKMMMHKQPYLFFDKSKEYAPIKALFDTDRPNVLIVTASSGAHKTYPWARWVEVIEKLDNSNVLLVAGSPKERLEAEKIVTKTDAKLLPPIDLNTLKYVVYRSDLLIGNDTGPSHMAWAMNRPSILLFGATPKTMMMQSPFNIAITSGTYVHPCRFDKNNRSIASIEPALVVNTTKRLLG